MTARRHLSTQPAGRWLAVVRAHCIQARIQPGISLNHGVVVFHQYVSNSGVGVIGWIMLGASVVLLLITFFDRMLRRSAAA
jgi:hypothetical protein